MKGVHELLPIFELAADADAPDDVYDALLQSHRTRVVEFVQHNQAAVAANAIALLNKLDPAANTIACLAILGAAIPSNASLSTASPPALRHCVSNLLAAFDPRQARYHGGALTRLLAVVATSGLWPADAAVALLAHALQRLDPSGRVLTSTHLVLAKLAYHTNQATRALPVVGVPCVFVPATTAAEGIDAAAPLCSRSLPPSAYLTPETGLSLSLKSSQVLEYEYVVGNLWLSAGDYAAAARAFARAISFPARDGAASKIMLAAHRRWLLASLVAHGRVDDVPDHTSPAVARLCTLGNKVYARLVSVFAGGSAAALAHEALGHIAYLVEHCDVSLACAAIAAVDKWRIARLADVYLTVPLSDLVVAPDQSLGQAAVAAVAAAAQAQAEEESASAMTDAPTDPAVFTGYAEITPPRPTTEQLRTAAAALSTAPLALGAEDDVARLVDRMLADGLLSGALVPADTAAGSPAYLQFAPETRLGDEQLYQQALQDVLASVAAVGDMRRQTAENLQLNRDYVRNHLRLEKQKENQKKETKTGGSGGGGSSSADRILFGDVTDEDLMM